MKNPRLYIAISSPSDYYFITTTEDVKTQVPISANYHTILVRHLISQLIEKFPGTIPDLAMALDVKPHIVWALNKGDYRMESALIVNASGSVVRNMINLYYRYILGTGARVSN